MTAYNVMIVDDDPQQARILEELISQTAVRGRFNVDSCTSLAALEKQLEKGYMPDIVFMDIVFSDSADCAAMPENGIDAARRLLASRPGVQLIYVTGYAEYCTRVYRTEHIYFLLKPVSRIDFEDALEKAVCMLAAHAARPFGVKVGGRIMRVVPDDIEYIESDRRKVRIVMGENALEAYDSLSGILQKLPGSFVQCHKSFIVNMDKIVEMRGDSVLLASGAGVPVSQKRSRETREAFTAYLLERL